MSNHLNMFLASSLCPCSFKCSLSISLGLAASEADKKSIDSFSAIFLYTPASFLDTSTEASENSGS